MDDPDVPVVAHAGLTPVFFLDPFDDPLDLIQFRLVLIDGLPDFLPLFGRQRPLENPVRLIEPQRTVLLQEKDDERDTDGGKDQEEALTAAAAPLATLFHFRDEPGVPFILFRHARPPS